MIPNITRGGDVRGVITYLVGTGRREEHVDPHLVAGSAEAVMLNEGRTLDNADVGELARLLDEPRVSPREPSRDPLMHRIQLRRSNVCHHARHHPP
jgi:hypothetical protein